MNEFHVPLLKYPKLPEGQHAFEITDPAVACAVARCWLGRQANPLLKLAGVHPVLCGWCDYPLDLLICSLNDFWALEDNWKSIRDFGRMSRAVQENLVKRAAHET
jgi:hypothetical protein